MSFLKQILSPFVEFEDQPKKDRTTDAPSQPVPAYIPPAPGQPADHPLFSGAGLSPQPPAPAPAQRTVVTALPEHRQYFDKLIEDANANNPLFQGVDYKEFVDTKLNVDSIADEETKYKTAFNVLKKSGITKEKLLSTAQEYHNLIGRDMNGFQSAHMQHYHKETRQREQLMQQKAEEVLKLTEQVNALKKEITRLSQEMAEKKEKLNLTKNSFLLAGENKQQEIQTDIQKIQRYF